MKISKQRLDMENARLERPVVKRYHETVVSVVATTTTALDISTGNVFNLSQDTDITTLNITNPTSSGNSTTITIIRTKDATATPRLISWPAAFKWAGGAPAALTQSSGAVDIIEAFTTDGGATWIAFAAGVDMR